MHIEKLFKASSSETHSVYKEESVTAALWSIILGLVGIMLVLIGVRGWSRYGRHMTGSARFGTMLMGFSSFGMAWGLVDEDLALVALLAGGGLFVLGALLAILPEFRRGEDNNSNQRPSGRAWEN